jgi:hypothetical protein
MQKVVLFAFNGELMCFVHVLLNALDMKEKGFDVKIVIEGSATKLISDLGVEGNLLNGPFRKAQAEDMIDGVCKACATKMGTLEDAKALGLALLSDMWGHPGMAKYLKDGYEVITF